jgi:hypothetical protein
MMFFQPTTAPLLYFKNVPGGLRRLTARQISSHCTVGNSSCDLLYPVKKEPHAGQLFRPKCNGQGRQAEKHGKAIAERASPRGKAERKQKEKVPLRNTVNLGIVQVAGERAKSD